MKEKEDFFQILGNNIKEARLQKGFTVKELASKSNLNINYLCKIERGKAYGILTQQLISLILALHIHPKIIFKDL